MLDARSELDRLRDLPTDEVEEMACAAHLGVWTARRRGLDMSLVHWEWSELAMNKRRLALVAPREHGKALALDTPVRVPGGWRPIGELQPGDTVIGGNGTPTTVTATSPVFTDHDCYRLTLDDGQTFIADAEHRWVTHYAWRGTRVATTEQIVTDHAHRQDQRHVIDCVREESEDVDLPLDPYVLGYWLGDGATRTSTITTVDTEVVESFEMAGHPMHHSYRGCYSVRGIHKPLRELGLLGNKHVPDVFLWAGVKQRLELLRGLMDSDGYCSPKGQAEFTSMSPILADAVCRLVSSLGWKPKRCVGRAMLNGKDCGEKHRVWFYPDEHVFRLKRKTDRQRLLPTGRRSKSTGRHITSVEPTMTVPVRCISTEQGTYLIGNEVLTHNSEALSVHATAWRSIYNPGLYTYMFALTSDLAEELLARTRNVIDEIRPDLVAGARRDKATDLILGNGARVRAAGAGKRTRGGHPDVIIGDDVLDEENTATSTQRRKIYNWWFGSVVPMAHPGTMRQVTDADGASQQLWMPATRVHLVGTPFHASDLLLGMRDNPLWHFRRYSAEFNRNQLVDGTLAVEVTG